MGLKEAAQMALDWRDKNSELLFELGGWDFIFEINQWSQSLRGALAQPEQEPVAWFMEGTFEDGTPSFTQVCETDPEFYVPLYTAPPQREWVGLTDEEMMVAAFQAGFDVHEDYDNEDDPDALHWWSEDGERCDDTLHKLRDIIEAKLREKNFDRPS